MRIATNLEAARWIPGRLHPFAQDVGSVVPEGFAAYARIFHPPYKRTVDGEIVPVRWHDIAAANDRTLGAEMRRLDMSSDPTEFSPGDVLWDQQASLGSIPRAIAVQLVTTLRGHTQSPGSCWFAVWEGWGDLRIRHDSAPMLSIPSRNCFLLNGPIDDALTTLSEIEWSYRSPNLWWPDDRAWCVATEIDFKWTYVGGSASCIDQVLRDPELEAVPTTPSEGNVMEK